MVLAESAAMHITSQRSAGKDSPSRYEGYADLSLDEIADVYGLDLHEYLDMAAYSENSKKQILEAIKKDRKESA